MVVTTGKTLCDALRADSEPAWTAATTHRFTRELGAGTLDDDVFRRYLALDYEFVELLAGLVGHAIADAPTMAAKRRLSTFLASIVGPENDYFDRAFDALDVDPGQTPPDDSMAAVRAFEDLFARAAASGGYAETLAVLLPVEWVYLTWATDVERPPGPFYLGEWVDIHATDDFEEFVSWLRGELDREGATLSPRRQRRVRRLFALAVSLEVEFFDAAYGGAP